VLAELFWFVNGNWGVWAHTGFREVVSFLEQVGDEAEEAYKAADGCANDVEVCYGECRHCCLSGFALRLPEASNTVATWQWEAWGSRYSGVFFATRLKSPISSSIFLFTLASYAAESVRP